MAKRVLESKSVAFYVFADSSSFFASSASKVVQLEHLVETLFYLTVASQNTQQHSNFLSCQFKVMFSLPG